jgi:periplasmic copper chaperone A
MSSTTRVRAIAASLAAVLALGGLAACGSESKGSTSATTTGSGSVTVTDAWARESAMSSGDGAAYFTITNGGKADDELTAVSVPSTVAAMAQIHETVEVTDTTGGGMSGSTEGSMSGSTMGGSPMMTMQEVESVTVPAGGTVSFAPGGYHVMLMDLVAPLEVGQTIPLTLTFAKAGTIEVTATVRAS